MHLLFLTFSLVNKIPLFSLTHKNSLPPRLTPTLYTSTTHRTNTSRRAYTKRNKRQHIKRPTFTKCPSNASTLATIDKRKAISLLNIAGQGAKQRTKRKRSSTKVLQKMLRHIQPYGNLFCNTSTTLEGPRVPYRTTLKITAGAIPRFEAGPQGSMLRRDDR